jgi:hypothetical protein
MTAALKVPHTFEIRPTPGANSRPDELMIDWGSLPGGSVASLYFPEVDAEGMIAKARTLYGTTPLVAADAHTLTCPARELTYLPVPTSTAGSLAGLLVIEPPAAVRPGQQFTVDVVQLTSTAPAAPKGAADETLALHLVRRGLPADFLNSTWRHPVGAFRLRIPVAKRPALRESEERLLSILRWILTQKPTRDRNYLTFRRYVELYAERVAELGGDPDRIPASANGTWPGEHGEPARPSGHHRDPDERWGKVEALIFDHFGDFEGFVLETEAAERLTFFSRQEGIQVLVTEAMGARLRVSIVPEAHDRFLVRRVILHQTPESFSF